MKKSATLILLLCTVAVCAQKNLPATNDFLVTGQVKKELKFNLTDITKYSSKDIGEVAITNHLGEPRSVAKQLKGVLVKDLLKELELSEESPKRFSEFYLTFIAADNYKVVYSWNEIFNAPTGDNLFLIISRDGKKMEDMEDRILVLTPTDFKTGRRHIKGLCKIVIDRAD